MFSGLRGPFSNIFHCLISQFYPSDPVPVFPIICSRAEHKTKHGLFPKGESLGLYMEYGHWKANPRYAVLSYPSAQGSIGGLKINEPMEALDRQHVPVAGLYVLGNDAGGWNSDAYYIISCTGSAFGFAINSGRIAAENAAPNISEKQAITGCPIHVMNT